ncbi:MAG: hypothetical protein K2Q06_09185 [Parvularculaceae bacterium]|nr:hypothetical protein [Parvularculaceae bacterium]
MREATVLDSMSAEAIGVLKSFEDAIAKFGPSVVEAKKTTLHFRPADGGTKRPAFAGARPLKSGLRLTLVLREPPQSARVVKSEKVSASRWHVEVILGAGRTIDGDLKAWLGDAYALQAERR